MQQIGFGGGCHWCTEAVSQSLRGVVDVRQGFIISDPPNNYWSEAVDIQFNPEIIRLEDLVNVHLATHASTSNHSMRSKYRSAIYTIDAQQHVHAETALFEAATDNNVVFVTKVLAHRGFKYSGEQFHNYYIDGPDKPFCQSYIEPKLIKLRKQFSKLMSHE